MKLETAKRIQKYYEWFRITLLVILVLLLFWGLSNTQ